MLYSQAYTNQEGSVHSTPIFGELAQGLTGGSRPFATPQYSGQEGNYNNAIRELLKAGVSPEDIRKYGPQLIQAKNQFTNATGQLENQVAAARQSVTNMTGTAGTQRAQAVQQAGMLFPRSGLLGGALAVAPSILGAVESAREERPLEAGVSAAVGVPTALGAAAIGARVGGLPGAAIGIGGALLAPMLGQGVGGLFEKAKAQLTGDEIGGQPGSRSAASGQRAKDRAEAMKDAELQAQIAQRYGSTYLQPTLQAIQDLRQNDIDMMVQAEKRLDPIIRQRLNEQMTRQQSLNAHLAQQNAMLGTIATAGALAQGAQAETGATLRTALTANPYASSVLQAPQIKFG